MPPNNNTPTSSNVAFRAAHNHESAESIAREYDGKTVAEMEVAYNDAVTNVHSIQAQLSSRPNRAPDGGLLSQAEFADYTNWRRKATSALRYATLRLRVIKQILKRERRAAGRLLGATADVDDSSSNLELLEACNSLLCKLLRDGIEFSAKEIQLISVTSNRLKDSAKVEGRLE